MSTSPSPLLNTSKSSVSAGTVPHQESSAALAKTLASLNDVGARLSYLASTFPQSLVASTSAGLQSAALLHLLAKHAPSTPVIWIDTGYHFAETYQYFEQLKQSFPELKFIEASAKHSAARQEALYGKRWEQDAEALKAYNLENKVEPMNRMLTELQAKCWISGLRTTQSKSRAKRQFAEQQNRIIKAYPILDWSDADMDTYLHVNELPRHPLAQKGYLSVGDWHSSRPAKTGESAEETRFQGQQRECGLHELSNQPDFQI